MKNLWNEEEAKKYTTDLQLRVYSSRLLGANPELVLHGGGNTSVKIIQENLFGEEENILYVKGSGWDLASIEEPGFTPIRMNHLLKLAELKSLSDTQMVNEMKTHQTLASAPTGSVEAILHAALPFKYVDHTHADAVVTITNSPGGEARIREIYGKNVIVVPYVMPGFDLARLVAQQFEKEGTPDTVGMVLMNHGIFSFGETAKASYDSMIALVSKAESYLASKHSWDFPLPDQQEDESDQRHNLVALRAALSEKLGAPVILNRDSSPYAMSFCRKDNVGEISQQGPATPDHVIRTKRVPMIGRDVEKYAEEYEAYFKANEVNARTAVTMLDPVPRVILDESLGMLTAGRTVKDASINADIYRHTMRIIQRAEMLGGWEALSMKDIFDMEYWELEQAKLKKRAGNPEFQGEVALVTGAASGIGRACAEALMHNGAAVVGLDLNPDIERIIEAPAFFGVHCDVTDNEQVEQALKSAINQFGGIDMLVLNAGYFPGGTPIAELSDELWDKVLKVNLDSNLSLMRECYPYLKHAPKHGRVVIIGSKNVPAPGIGAAAYSASKAGLNQLARIAAMEWATDGIRVNTLHPDAVFDTGIWSDDVLAARAEHYGMTVEDYKKRNLLKTAINSSDVAELATVMCGRAFSKTTAAQVPVDGGNDRVI